MHRKGKSVHGTAADSTCPDESTREHLATEIMKSPKYFKRDKAVFGSFKTNL